MPLEKSQLISAKRLLRQALALVTDVRGIFDGDGNSQASGRLDAIRRGLVNEIEEIEQLIATQSP